MSVLKSAITGAVSGAVGGSVGVNCGSQSGGWAGFGSAMAGTGAGTTRGLAVGAAWGDEITWQSAGMAFGSAFAGTIASTALSKGYQAAVEADTAGRAAVNDGNGSNLTRGQREAYEKAYAERYSKIDWQKTLDSATWYDSEKMAAYAFLDQQNPRSISIDREIYSIIVERNGKFAALPAQVGLQNTWIASARRASKVSRTSRRCTRTVGMVAQ